MGASIGEAAPKLLGGASGSVLSGWAGLSARQRKLVVACGGGDGLAAVYNVRSPVPCSPPKSSSGASPCPSCCGHRVLLDRDRHGVDIPAQPGRLSGHPRLSLHMVPDDLGAAGGAGHRADLLRLHPAHRMGVASPRQGDQGAVRAADSLRHPRRHRHPLPPAFRQRPGHGPRRVPRAQRLRPDAYAVRAQAAGHGPVPGQRGIWRTVHPDAQALARSSAAHSASHGTWPGPRSVRRVRHGLRGRHDRGGHASSAIRPRPRARAHPQRIRADSPHDGGDGGRHAGRLPRRRILHLLRPAAGVRRR